MARGFVEVPTEVPDELSKVFRVLLDILRASSSGESLGSRSSFRCPGSSAFFMAHDRTGRRRPLR